MQAISNVGFKSGGEIGFVEPHDATNQEVN